MNCEQMREQLVETARGRELSSDLRAIVFSHAAGCDECAQRLEHEQRLTRALLDLSLDGPGAPTRIEHIIRRALPLQMTPVSIRKPTLPAASKWAAVAIAAGFVLCAFVFRPAASHPPQPVAANVAASVAANVAADVLDNDDFTPLPYAEDLQPGEQADVVSVQMTRGSLLAMGVPVSADQLGDQVQAELLLGMDGTPRAVRLAD